MPLVHRKQITISLPHDMIEWLKAQSEKEGRYPGRLIERLLSQYKDHINHAEKNIFKNS